MKSINLILETLPSLSESIGHEIADISGREWPRRGGSLTRFAVESECCNIIQPLKNICPFTKAYIEAILWSNADDNNIPIGERFGIDDFYAGDAFLTRLECEQFIKHCGKWITEEHCISEKCSPMEQAGHDFWLTRCGYRSGFWDGGWSGEAGDAMTKYSRECGSLDLYIASGKIYLSYS